MIMPRGRPRIHPIPDPVPPMMVYECTDRRGMTKFHRLSGALTAHEAMERLGVLSGEWHVMRYPVNDTSRYVEIVQDYPR